jgi:prepilin-type N-terminal cleavage/methylation domain-containing protein
MSVSAMMKKPHPQGFSLLELSVVLLIMGFVASALLSMGISQSTSSRYEYTENNMKEIERALGAFLLANSRLPCPMPGSLAPDAADYGFEDTSASCADTYIAAENIYAGAVPFAALGLPDSYMLDAWDHRILYVVDDRFTTTAAFLAAMPNAPPLGRITIMVSGDDVSGQRRTSQAAVVLVSHGANGYGAWPKTQIAPDVDRINPDPSTISISAAEIENAEIQHTAGAPLSFDDIFSQETRNSRFDDVVRYMDRWQLIKTSGGIINQEFCEMVDLAIQDTNPNVFPQLGAVGCINSEDKISSDYNCEGRQKEMAQLLAQLCGIQ